MRSRIGCWVRSCIYGESCESLCYCVLCERRRTVLFSRVRYFFAHCVMNVSSPMEIVLFQKNQADSRSKYTKRLRPLD